jgi:hypothetical protein
MLLVLVCMMLMAVSIVWLGYALLRPDGTITPFFPLVVPGVLAVLSSPLYNTSHDYGDMTRPESARPVFGTLWSYTNGMESAAVIVSFAAATLLLVRRPRLETTRGALGMGAVLLLLTLSRVDHVFFSLCLLALLFFTAWMHKDKQALLRSGIASAVLIVGMGVYLAVNKAVFDSALPVSGKVKSTLPFFTNTNIESLVRTLGSPNTYQLAQVTRLFLLLAPMLVTPIFVLYALKLEGSEGRISIRMRDGRTPLDAVMLACVPAVLVLGAYNFFFVPLKDQGYWYFPVSTLFVSLFVISALDQSRLVRRLDALRRPHIVALAVVAACSIAFFFTAHRRAAPFKRYAQFYLEEAPQILARYGESRPKLIEFDDGIVAAATGFPTMSGLGLALDPVAAKHVKPDPTVLRYDKIFDIAMERGFNCMTTVQWDSAGSRLGPNPSKAELLRRVSEWVPAKKLEPYDLVLDYYSGRTNFWIICAKQRT